MTFGKDRINWIHGKELPFGQLTGHRVLDRRDNNGDDCTGDTAAYSLPDNRNIDILSSSEHRQESGENLPPPDTAKRTRDCVAAPAEIVVFDACSISADSACYKLDDDVDDR
jgi:hypothetical protein